MKRSPQQPGARFGVRSYLIALTLGVLVPMVVFATLAVVQLSAQQRAATEDALINTARALAIGLDAQMSSTIASLNALAASYALGRGHLAEFHADARRVVQTQPSWAAVLLVSPDGRQLVNTSHSYGASLPPVNEPGSLAEVVASRRPVIGFLVRGREGGRLAFPVRVPVVRDGRLAYVLTAVVTPQPVTELLARQKLPLGALGVVVDRSGVVVTRVPGHGEYAGRRATPTFLASTADGRERTYRAVALDGRTVYGAFSRARLSDWIVAVALPAEAVEAPMRGAITEALVVALSLLAVSVAAALVLGRKIAVPLSAAARAADALVERRAERVPASAVREIEQLTAAIQDSRDRVWERERRLRVLAKTAGDLLRVSAVREVLARVFDPLAEDLGLEVYVSYLVEDDGRTLRLDSHAGVSAEAMSRVERLSAGEGVCGVVAATRSTLVAEDVQRSSDAHTEFLRTVGITAYACFPLLARGELVGTLSFGTRRRPRFSTDELELLEAVANHVAVAVERARLIRRLEEANVAKDEFLAMLGHELRNPLGAIASAAGVLDRLGSADRRAVMARDVVTRQTRHLKRLVDDLLDVTRVTAGKIVLSREPLDLAATVDRVVDVFAHANRLDGHPVEVRAEPAWVEGDRPRIEQVVDNLLTNALKYTPAGGRIALHVDPEGDVAVLRVIDEGVGLTPDLLPHVFEPFVQGQRAIDRRDGGLGIGLALVRRLVELHGGSVEARSEGPGCGSEFIVRLPRIVTPAPDRESPTVEPAPQARRILIVEDNDDAREALRTLVELDGHEVHVAADGAEALALAERVRPDVAIIDIGLPGVDGYEVARQLKRAMHGLTRLVALTGYGEARDRDQALAAGFDAHLVKPVDPHALARLVGERGTDARAA